MKFNIYINQYKLSENSEITIQDCAVIDWLYSMFGSNSEKISKSRVEGWTWISLTHLIEDMPLLRIKTNSGASKIIGRIKKMGFIETKTDRKERKLLAKPTKKLYDLYFSNKVRKETTQVLKETSQVLQDTNHNTNIIKLNTNNTAPPKVEDIKPFSFEEEMEKLGKSKWKGDKIIYLYFVKKNYVFENRKQFDVARKRNTRAATALLGYNSQQIEDTMDFCETSMGRGFTWTLETVGKKILEVINKK